MTLVRVNKTSGGSMAEIVWLYRDDSAASHRVETELAKRKIRYDTVWDQGSGRLLPAIETRGSFFQGLANIEVYYFGLLDAGSGLRPSK